MRSSTLGELVGEGEARIGAFCDRSHCGRRLGVYVAYRIDGPGPARFSISPPGDRLVTRPPRPGRRGPRSGTGLHLEPFDQEVYVRKRCPCGATEKRRTDRIGSLPVSFPQGSELPQVPF